MLLHFFELREAFLNVLVELDLHLLGDRGQLGVHTVTDTIEALRGLLIHGLKFGLELLRGEKQGARHLAASIGQTVVLLFPALFQLLLDRGANV